MEELMTTVDEETKKKKFGARLNEYADAVDSGRMTVNEFRTACGLHSLGEEGDVYYTVLEKVDSQIQTQRKPHAAIQNILLE